LAFAIFTFFLPDITEDVLRLRRAKSGDTTP